MTKGIHIKDIPHHAARVVVAGGHLGSWPVRKAATKLKAAASGSSDRARSFVSGRKDQLNSWREERALSRGRKHAAAVESRLKSMNNSGRVAATALVGAALDRDIGAIAGAIATLETDPNQPALLKNAVGKLNSEKRDALWSLDFEEISAGLKKLGVDKPAGELRKSIRQAVFEAEREETEGDLLTGPMAAAALLGALVDRRLGDIAGAAAALNKFADGKSTAPLLAREIENLRDHGQQKVWNCDFEEIRSELESFLPGKWEDDPALALFEIQRKEWAQAPFTIDGDGNVSGQLDDPGIHSSVGVGPAPNSAQHTIVSFMETRTNGRLKNEVEWVDGQPITREGKADFHRMNIKLMLGNGIYRTRGAGTEERLKETVEKLRELAAGDSEAATTAATKVLSSILNQHEFRDLVRGWRNKDGQEVSFLNVGSNLNDVRVYDSSGDYEKYVSQQIGSAELTVSKQHEDFLVEVKWPFLADRVMKDKKILKVYPGNPAFTPTTDEEKAVPCAALLVTLSGSFVVSGKDAQQGQVKITKAAFTQTVSGKLQKPGPLPDPKAAVGNGG